MKKTIITLAFLLSLLLAACSVQVCRPTEPFGYHPGFPNRTTWATCQTVYNDGQDGKTWRIIIR